MEFVTFRDLSLSPEESRYIIEFIAQKRNVNNYKDKSNGELLSAIKEKSKNLTPKKPSKKLKRKKSEILTLKISLKNLKRKIRENLTSKKSLKNPKRKITENLTSKKSLKNPKRENNQILTFKNKERIDIIREELKDLSYKLSRSELKEIKKNLYNIEKRKQYESKETIRYLDKLDKRIILKLDRYPQDYDDSEYKGVKDVCDLFK